MTSNNSNIKKLESGRADFAYKCAEEAVSFHKKIDTSFSFDEYLKAKLIKDKEKPENKEIKEREIKQYIDEGKIGSKISEKDFKEAKEKFAKEYKSNVKKVPMHIKTNGLGASCAFMLSKAKKENNPWQLVYQQLQKWFLEDNKFCKHKPEGEKEIILDGKNTDLVKFLVQIDSSHYRAMTVEALALFNWLRRFAEGLIEGEE